MWLLHVCAGYRCPGTSSRGCRGDFCEQRPGAAPYWTRPYQVAPADPPQGTAEALRQDSGPSGKAT